jgi:hypothetical protein
MRVQATPSGGAKSSQSGRDAAMARVAGGQDGAVSLLLLSGLGFAYMEVRWRVAQGWLHPKHRGVFAVEQPKRAAA